MGIYIMVNYNEFELEQYSKLLRNIERCERQIEYINKVDKYMKRGLAGGQVKTKKASPKSRKSPKASPKKAKPSPKTTPLRPASPKSTTPKSPAPKSPAPSNFDLKSITKSIQEAKESLKKVAPKTIDGSEQKLQQIDVKGDKTLAKLKKLLEESKDSVKEKAIYESKLKELNAQIKKIEAELNTKDKEIKKVKVDLESRKTLNETLKSKDKNDRGNTAELEKKLIEANDAIKNLL